MKNYINYFFGSVLLILFAYSFVSFKPAEEYCEPIMECSAINSVPIPKEIEIFDTIIPLARYDLRERFDREILSFAYYHSMSITTIKRANLFMPIIEPILKKNGIPNDFKYLAMIESNFNVRAVSSAKAAGIWQLMPETARELGLEVNAEVDERYNVEKSTEAACKYFKRAYKKFGCWFSVAASYNVGMGGVNGKLNRQESSDPMDLLLPEETSRYIFRIFAAKELMKDPQKYGFRLRKEDMYHTVGYTEHTVDTAIVDLVGFAKQFNISYYQLKNFNVWLRDYQLPNKSGKTYIIKIPNIEDLNFDIKKVFIYQKNWVL